jgi:hypothetical protein
LPAGTCNLMKPTIFFAMNGSFRVQTAWRNAPGLPCVNTRERPGSAASPLRRV